ncbi:glycosyltransferase family 2 protein [archaeon]|jgi:GT2 family glycosyltransferase|nr:glycosyltransferase family 2 protein [archaeon]
MKNKNPLVNIIILNWNNYEDTKECIDSIKKIDYKDWRITLIDNGSTDNSTEKFVELYKHDKRIKLLLNKENLGFAGGNNLGMKKDLFGTDYFLLLNNDAIVEKRFLTNLLKEKRDLIAPLIYNYYSKEKLSKRDYPGKFNFLLGGGKRAKIKSENIQKVDYASGCCWLIKKDLFLATKGFDEDYFAYNEEIELAYRLNKMGKEFYITKNAKIWHKGARTSNKISGLKLRYMNRNIILFERKYAQKTYFLIFLFYFFLYKVPKNLIKIILSKTQIRKKTIALIQGINEGFLTPV